MRWLVATGLALAATGAVHADPAVPQLNPQPARREDAQRLREQLRVLDREPPPPAQTMATTSGPSAPPVPPPRTVHRYTAAGITLIGTAAASGLSAIVLYASRPSDGADHADLDTATSLLALTAGATGIVGLVLLNHQTPVQVAPTITPHAVGLAITGRL